MLTHCLCCHIFIVNLEMGLSGCILATNITYILNMVLADLLVRFNQNFERTRQTSSYASIFRNWSCYLKIGIPSACMVCFEWWAFEILVVFSGYISIPALASEVIIVNIVSFLFMMPLGISFAASSLTGYYIGQGKVNLAKRFALLTILLNMVLSTLIILLMSLYKDFLAHLFIEDPDIIKIVHDMMWIIQIYVFFDGIHGV
jgi:multidrug resistance protein, MATE family